MPVVLFTFFFALCGLCIATVVFHSIRPVKRVWLGLVFGLLLLTWLPSLFAFFVGFTKAAQLFAAIAAGLFAVVSVLFGIRKKRFSFPGFLSSDLAFLWVVVPLFVLGAVLFSTHILHPSEDGSVSVGQVTYGDLAMHLGFISSIAEQGTFPPQYSIFPGHSVNYPFLCETSASSLVVLGASLRTAYLITALYAYLLVLLGVWFFFSEWLKTTRRTAVATLLFFLGGGFGFAYFFDLAKTGASLNTLLDGSFPSNFAWLLNGFYDTPTNLPTIGLRWVNPIVDMLIPQRATLFGWAFLFPCLTLLHGFAFRKQKQFVIPLAVTAGLLPLIHTHSFLALGIISAVYCLSDLIMHFEKKRLGHWALYAMIACLLAAPQLFGFAFRQASESSMVQPHWNWANNADSYLWFYVKNLGWLFLLLPIAFLTLSSRDRRIYLAPAVLWLLAEVLVFQPNTYDNNKLLFVWFAYTCGLVAKFLVAACLRLRFALRKRATISSRQTAMQSACLFLLALLLIGLIVVLKNDGIVKWYTVCTLLLLCGLCLWFQFLVLRHSEKQRERLLTLVPFLSVLFLTVCLFSVLYRGYEQLDILFDRPLLIVSLLLMGSSFVVTMYLRMNKRRISVAFSAATAYVALHLCVFLLALTMTLSSVMTILRELKSEYQVYSEDDLAVTAFIRSETEPDAVFLANSYLWNLVTPLTGRSIVTGTSTFLYFHGIDNTLREAHVRAMYEQPETSADLFREYNVSYILVGNAERYNYAVDLDTIKKNCSLIFENSSAQIYRIAP